MKKTYIVIVSAILILFCLMYSVSYAYFSIKVNNDFNNGTSGNTTIGSDTVKNIIISDGTKVTSSNIIPGESVTATFTVQNPNDVSLCFGLDWINVVNEFVNKSDIVVSLKDENGTVLLEDKDFPTENNTTLIEGLTIPANTTKTYTLTVTYKNTDKDQSVDMNKKFQATLTGKLTTCIYTAIETVEKLAKGANLNSKDVYTVPDKTSDTCTYTLAYDGDSISTAINIRYVGANPCNYVTFNGEQAGWRIIGILKTPEGQRIKLIRTNSIGNYAWDNKPAGTGSSLDSSKGSNNWTDSPLKEMLNSGVYYNRTSGECPSDSYGATIECDFTDNGLTIEAKNQIDDITWNLGGMPYYSSSLNGFAIDWYSYERRTEVYTGRETEWKGKVGLMYPSDYAFATSGGSTNSRKSCLKDNILYLWSRTVDCRNNNWLSTSSNISRWTLTTYPDYYNVFVVEQIGGVVPIWASNTVSVFPSLYLKSWTTILSGEGTPENPYVIG